VIFSISNVFVSEVVELLPSGVFVPDGNTEGRLDDEKDGGVGAMPKTSDI